MMLVDSYKRGSASAPTPDLLKWDFTNGSGTTVTATVGPNGTLSGGATWTTGPSGGGAIQFDGVDDTLITASSIAFGVKIITVCCWVYWNSFTGGWVSLFNSDTNPFTGGFFGFYPNGGQFDDPPEIHLVDTATTSTKRVEQLAAWSVNTWTHFAIVFDGSTNAGQIKAYKNGALESETILQNDKADSNNFATDTVSFFSTAFGGATPGGKLGRVRIYGRELTLTEVGQVYAESF